MWDIRTQDKFLDVRLKIRHHPVFKMGNSCPQTKEEEKSNSVLRVYSQDKQKQATFTALESLTIERREIGNITDN